MGHLLIVSLPLLFTTFAAQTGLAIGYQRMGLEPSWAHLCAQQDDSPGPGFYLSGVALLAAVAALTRRCSPGRQAILLLAGAGVWYAFVFFAYSMDAQRRGLDLTRCLIPGLWMAPLAATAIVLACSIVAYRYEPTE